MGGGKDIYAVVFSDRACWRQPAGDSEINYAEKKGIKVDNKVFFTSDPGLTEEHILVIDGLDYFVTSAPIPDSSVGLSVLWKVLVYNSSAEGR